MNYWLIKSEPGEYSFSDLVRDGRAIWDGVRNFQARRHLSEMRVGDRLFYYHSGPERAVVGLAEVVREAFPDPADPRWVAVEIQPTQRFMRPLSLAQIRADPRFAELALLRQPRLSVMPISVAIATVFIEEGQPIPLRTDR